MKTCSPHQFHEKIRKKCWFCVVYERWMCCSMWVLCVLSLRKCLCLDKKKEKKNNSIHLGPFLPLTAWHRPMINQITATPNPKKMFSTVFSESRVLPQKKKSTFWIYKKSQKSNRKTPNCHKTKMRMKEKKIVKTTSHTTYSHTRSKLHYIHTLIHQTSSLSIIHVIKSINQQNSQFSISTLLSSLYPNIRLQCLSISQSRWTRINPSDMKHWPGFPQQKAKKQKNQLFQRTPLIPRNHEFWFLLTHLPTLHQFLLFYKMSYVLHQMSDITTKNNK